MMSRRCRGYSPRKPRLRKPLRKIVIVCEGEKTERYYFEGLRTRGSGVAVIPLHGKCTDPKNIVIYAEEQMSKLSIDFDEGDRVYCVYDVDENKNNVLKDTYDHVVSNKELKNKITIVLSNPCFELWYLLHYTDLFSNQTREEVVEKLKHYVSDYTKRKKMNSLLLDTQADAIKRAKRLNKLHQEQNIDLVSRESNPSTQVFEIIEYLYTLIQRCA